MVDSGVFSSWEALDTNWFLELSNCSRRSDIELNACASPANSFLPRTLTRADRSPRLMREMPSFSSLMGRVMVRSTKPFTSITAAATTTSHSSIRIWMSRRLSYISCTPDMYTSTPASCPPE